MDTMSKAYKIEIANWTISSGEQPVSADQLFKLFGDTFIRVSTTSATNSFQNTGIWPSNRNLFKDEFNTVTLNPSSAINDLHCTRESSNAVIEKTCQPIKCNEDNSNQTTDLHEPMIDISQNNNQSCAIQEENQIDQSYIHFIQQENCLQMENETSGNTILPSNNERNEHFIVIPPKAQLTEIQLQDIELLSKNQRKLYFYISPIS